MLLKIICVAVSLALADAWGSLGHGDGADEYRGGHDDTYGSYQRDDYEDSDPVRVKRFGSKSAAKTLSPREIQEVKGAINLILSGYKQNNPFTPLPPIQLPNIRTIADTRASHRPRSAPQHENYHYNARTQYTDVTDDSKPVAQSFITNEATTSDPAVKSSTVTTDDNDETESNTDFIGATINSLSSLPEIPGTDEVVNSHIGHFATNELVPSEDATTKVTEIINYETETDIGLTGATKYAVPGSILPTGVLDSSDIKSEINSILGVINEHENRNTSNAVTREINRDDKDDAIINSFPTRSRPPDIRRDENDESEIVVTVSTVEEVDKEVTELKGEHSTLTPDEQPATQKMAEETATQNTNETVATQNTAEATAAQKTADVSSTEKTDEETDTEKTGEETTTQKTSGEAVTASTTLSVYTNSSSVLHKNTTKTTLSTKRIRTTKTKRTTTTKFNLDVPALLAIIANLTYDYEMNLTQNLNETLMKYSIPTCETPTTTVKRGLFVDYDENATGTIVAKCFVCGLEVEKIPRNAHCADAFAGDFLPLVPVDMTARGKISKYRKYCRYADVPHYMVNASQPRSVFGRWTGGCAVRWIDLSGVYTQRTCRNRERAIMGLHFASKRMAKLEMALGNVDNGCITSPMATLVPLSRGISLYARFHACVCTGSWCNAAARAAPWLLPLLALLAPILTAYVNPQLPI